MYTQCPDCGTVFRVTAAVLRAAQAQVRCGVCDAYFNALHYLSDDMGSDASAGAPPASRIVAAPATETFAAPAADTPEAPPYTASDAPADTPFPVATRHHPSAEETRVFEEISAAQARHPAAANTQDAPASAADSGDFNVLEPGDVDLLLLEPPAAGVPNDVDLEFNVAAADWERIFVAAEGELAPTPLDLDLLAGGQSTSNESHEAFLLLEAADGAVPEALATATGQDLAGPELDLDLPADDHGARNESHEALLLPEAADCAVAEALATATDHDLAGPERDPDLSVPAHGASGESPESLQMPEDVDGETHTELTAAGATGMDPAPPPAEAVAAEEEFEVELDLASDLGADPQPPAYHGATHSSDHYARYDAFDDPLAVTDEYPLLDLKHFAVDADAVAEHLAPSNLALDSADAADREAANDAVASERVTPQDAEPLAAAAAAATLPAYEHPAPPDDAFLAAETLDQLTKPTTPRAPTPPLQIAAAVLLCLALGGQLMHHARESLAESSIVGPPLRALYAALGAPLEARWNLADYEVRQWGSANEEAPGALRLRASIVNHAARAQPYPLLRVLLEDRFGGAVARREFRPAEYLPGHLQPRTSLAAGARADADLRIADPGNQAVGFELDVCLERHGVLSCGTDPKPPGS